MSYFCFLFVKNKIHVVGYNSPKTHPLSNNPYKMVHAETDAVLKYVRLKDEYRKYEEDTLKNVDALVVRLSTDKKKLRMSKPCSHCEDFLLGFGIRNVWYSGHCEDRYFKME